ncbi:MAG TPA: HAMP domain-containing protein, partial [Puia sp.]|nr:HAMP domain-containing protein [Puia sp.]
MEPYTNNSTRFPLLQGLSIRKQLPLLICLLLLVIILLFGAISYWGMRTAALGIGQQRLRSLTEQLASLFQQSARTLRYNTQSAAGRQEIVQYLEAAPGNRAGSGKALASLQKMLGDSRIVRAELRDPQGIELLHAGRPPKFPVDPFGTDSNFVGRFHTAGDSLYYPIAAAVMNGGKVLGYLFQWQTIRTTQRSMAQLTELLGGKATLYLGNRDGSSWSDMLHPIPNPVPSAARSAIAAYDRPGGRVMGYALPIPGTPWMTMVELSQDLILEAANRFLYGMMAIGAALILAGSFIAWLISRSFTRPLSRLMLATSELAHGNYAAPVAVHRRDE